MQARSPAGSDKAGPLQLSLQDDTSAPLVPGRVFSFLPPLLSATSHFSLQNHCHPNGGDAAMLSKVLCVGLGDGYTSVFTFCENHLGNSSKLYFDKKSTKKREQSLLPPKFLRYSYSFFKTLLSCHLLSENCLGWTPKPFIPRCSVLFLYLIQIYNITVHPGALPLSQLPHLTAVWPEVTSLCSSYLTLLM